MRMSKFRELTKHLPLETPVYISPMDINYAKQNPDQSSYIHSYSQHDGQFSFYSSLTHPPTLSEIYETADDMVLEIDIEDGFIYRDVKDVLILSDRIILLSN